MIKRDIVIELDGDPIEEFVELRKKTSQRGVFLTGDAEYFKKAKEFGQIKLL